MIFWSSLLGSLGGLDGLDQLGDDLEQVAGDAVIGNLEDGSGLVLVDGDDALGILHTSLVLDRAGDKGLKTRVTGTDVWVTHMEGAYGLSATPIAFSEVFSSLQQGVVNAVFNPISSMYSMRFHELCDYLVLTKANYDFAAIIVSTQSWNKLTDEQKSIMQECEDAIRAEVNEYIKTEDATYIDLMKQENPDLKVIELDNTALLEAGRAVAPQVIELCNGQELYDAIRACA